MIKMSPKIEKLIIKYITKSATADDIFKLSEWIKFPNNKKLFKEYVKLHYTIYYSISNPDSKKILDKLLVNIQKEKFSSNILKRILIYKYKHAAAAAIVGIILSIYFFKDYATNNVIENITPRIVNASIEPGSDKATLTLEDGSMIALEKGNSFQTPNAVINGDEIVYKAKNFKTKDIVYNYLTIPRGGQFFVKLSDGTKVWLNSESQLKYPVSFVEEEIRKVELIYGEAYFQVSPSTNNNGFGFIVYSNKQEIHVLGTEFNIKAYNDESDVYTTLVEGSVNLIYEDSQYKLTPNQQSIFNKKNNGFSVNSVDVYSEISWKDGIFSFERKTLKEMMKVLSRWYDIEILIENKSIENQEFVGILRKNKKLEDILNNIKNFGIIKNYKILDNKKIVIE